MWLRRIRPFGYVAGGSGSRTVLATTSVESPLTPPILDEVAAARKSAVPCQVLTSAAQVCTRFFMAPLHRGFPR